MTTQLNTLPAAIQKCAEAVVATASGIRPEQLGDRTPCEKYTVAELLDHLGTTLSSSARAARKEAQPGEAPAKAQPGEAPAKAQPGEAPAPGMSPRAVADSANSAAAAWGLPGAYEGTTVFGPGEMPAGFAATITLEELALHGWDLARATGSPFTIGEDAAQAALGAVQQIADQARAAGSFGPPVPVAADATVFDRALAASGRNPGWAR